VDYYYITGSSKGLGKALAEHALQSENTHVTGIARSNSIQHENYKHIQLDLSDTTAVANFQFEVPSDANRIVLINNAGAIGEIKYAGRMDTDTIVSDYNVNLVSPSILCHLFIKATQEFNGEKMILNVSSGAGKSPIDGWGTYCASKAGIDLFSRVAAKEQNLQNANGVKIWSVAPGIVDTDMQVGIRSAEVVDFSRVDEFVDYKESGKLADAKSVAAKYFQIIESPDQFPEVLCSVRDF
jgi:benzil reductase ((S)-benzoin forming)